MRASGKVKRCGLLVTVWLGVVLALVVGGCWVRDAAVGEEVAGAVAEEVGPALLQGPMMVAVSASAYRKAVGVWPVSVDDLEAFYEGPAFDIDWRALRGKLEFEALADGRLRIDSNDPEFDLSITVDVPREAVDE
jgi:hypothetical protein